MELDSDVIIGSGTRCIPSSVFPYRNDTKKKSTRVIKERKSKIIWIPAFETATLFGFFRVVTKYEPRFQSLTRAEEILTTRLFNLSFIPRDI